MKVDKPSLITSQGTLTAQAAATEAMTFSVWKPI